MHFCVEQIASMLEEYETDQHTEMNRNAVAEEIYQYTAGYPVLVSLICKCIDEKITGSEGFELPKTAWSKEGVMRAVGSILKESTPLFESMIKQAGTMRHAR